MCVSVSVCLGLIGRGYLGDYPVVRKKTLCLAAQGVSDLREGGVGPKLPRDVERGSAHIRYQFRVCLKRVVTTIY